MSMSPEEKNRMDKLEKLVQELLNVTNVQFIKSLERRLNFVSGTIALNELSDVDTTGQSSGEVLKFNGSTWVPGTDEVV